MTRPRGALALAWLDHDVSAPPGDGLVAECRFKLDAHLDAVSSSAVDRAWAIFASLNTGVSCLARWTCEGDRILHERALTAAAGAVECQLLRRRPRCSSCCWPALPQRHASPRTPLARPSHHGTCHEGAWAGGGTPEKPFGA